MKRTAAWKQGLIRRDAKIVDAIQAIDASTVQIALVLGADDVLLGTITDGDVRRALLRGATLQSSVEGVMNMNPVTAAPDTPPTEIRALMRNRNVRQVPVVDRGIVIDLVLEEDLSAERYENEVILMAGGLGTRLGELTKSTPKPLLRVGGKPILETILEGFLQQGFYRFRIAINYRGEMIRDYFGDGERWGGQIRYIDEEKRLGTAGALSLLDEHPTEPFFVMNGDLLTKVNYAQMRDFHRKVGGAATVAVREYDVQVPFGVVETKGDHVTAIAEKPVHRYFVSAGIYVLEPSCLSRIPHNSYFDMPTLLRTLLEDGEAVSSFPVHEFWLDIGRIAEFERANSMYPEIFE